MKLHYLLFVCVAAAYSGGDFFTHIQANPSVNSGGLFYYAQPNETSIADDTQPIYRECSSFPKPEKPNFLGGLSPSYLASPLTNAHAHNDYAHERPLFDALSQGFSQIEVDVHLIGGELYVSHMTPLILSDEKTLRNLYMEPLKQVIERNGGTVFPSSDHPLQLMVDIKTDAAKTYAALKTFFEPYRCFLTSFENGVKTERAVTILLSGNRPLEQVLAEKKNLMALDGRIEDLGKGIPPDLMPMVSERFSNVFGWEILGQVRTENQWLTLQRLARLTHLEGKKLRLWASPDEEAVWEKLLAAGCDIINTDELKRLNIFLGRRSLTRIVTR